ncbi:hypothetical protein F511_47749 [Dorcoceras hygrometricum]|uniref:Uncharacterized protein n=1 Tax=Dorcoceras hygrometricum TaxID=472368 RepID=A0A2Z6ZQD6_9LAMI|nr:hypothetical protein F511_47749 [Dorcoceras hygrometricum]
MAARFQRLRCATVCAPCALAIERRSPPVRDHRARRARSCARCGGAPPHAAAAGDGFKISNFRSEI